MLRSINNYVILLINVLVDLRDGTFDVLDGLFQLAGDRLDLERLVLGRADAKEDVFLILDS